MAVRIAKRRGDVTVHNVHLDLHWRRLTRSSLRTQGNLMFALLETNFVSPLSASAGLTKWTTDGSEARWQVGSRDEHISHVYEDVLPCAPSPRGRAPSGVAEGCGAWRHPPSVP